MVTLEELRRERDKLKAQREVRESMNVRNIERRQLKAEIRREKHPGLYNFGSKVKEFKKGDAIIQGIFKKFLESDNCNTEVERKGGQGHTSEKGTK